ncbi:YqaA family protein [Pseudomonas vanderleydeniana]|uniref:DedA family protein n=1 Tax=Pseudomonas vanderleydeniana TaxID=2745495 RepID=A0A9E6TQ70_9PSED|nr:YqaA family protein [Pseudomonas vanderleydeniana]QXI26579.1 DedA family protein [Pseudomonas vanderleydeniana]
MWETGGYLGLFLSAFGAATLLPLQSEAVLLALLWAKQHPALVLLIVATAGNVAGSLVNWVLGRYLEHWRERKWFPVSAQRLERVQHTYHRYGRWSLLLSWMPIIGDPLTVVAGLMREPWWSFLLIVTLAKAGRYGALYLMTLGWV